MSAPVCHSITRQSASNLAQAFIVLPPEKRTAMAALYAFCREVDDVADEMSVTVELRRERLAAWRQDVHTACTGGSPEFPVNRELQAVIQRYRLAFELFDEVIRGCEMDLEARFYADWKELELYCYRVASAVGLLSIEIFEYRNPASRQYAVALGKAFQLTNILRDVGEDAARGRIYLPQSELQRGGVKPEEILEAQHSDRFAAVAREVAGRAREFYRDARQLLPVEDRRSMIAAELMGAVYWRLLTLLERRGFQVLGTQRTRVKKSVKLYLIARTWWRLRIGPFVPNYGP